MALRWLKGVLRKNKTSSGGRNHGNGIGHRLAEGGSPDLGRRHCDRGTTVQQEIEEEPIVAIHDIPLGAYQPISTSDHNSDDLQEQTAPKTVQQLLPDNPLDDPPPLFSSSPLLSQCDQQDGAANGTSRGSENASGNDNEEEKEQVVCSPTHVTYIGNVTVANSSNVVIGSGNTVTVESVDRPMTNAMPTSPTRKQSDHLLPTIRRILREHYRKTCAHLKPFPWEGDFTLPIRDIFTNLEVSQVTRDTSLPTGSPAVRRFPRLDQIFFTEGFPNEIRLLLIEGSAGMGKSTVISKLAFDWSVGCFPPLENKLLFVLELRRIQAGKLLKDIVYEQLFDKYGPVSCEDVWDTIICNQNKVAFLLDGYDELAMSADSEITALTEGKILKETTVVITSRPSHAMHLRGHMDRCLQITGFTPANIKQYITSYCQHKNLLPDRLLTNISSTSVVQSIASIPIYTMLLCVLWEENTEGDLPESVTELYTSLVSFVWNRHCDKKGTHSSELSSACKFLGELALDGLLKDRLWFPASEIEGKCTDWSILQSGFLCKERGISKFERQGYYHFLHKLFQEYFAASYISHMLHQSEPTDKPVLPVLSRVCANHRQFHYLILFISGLIHDKFQDFFEFLVINKPQTEAAEFVSLCCQCLFESRQSSSCAFVLDRLIHDGIVNLSNEGRLFQKLPLHTFRAVLSYMTSSKEPRALILNDNYLTVEVIKLLADNLGSLSIEYLSLAYCFLSRAGADVLSNETLSDLPLRSINLQFNSGLGHGNLSRLCPFLSGLTKMVHLDLSHSNLSDSDCFSLADVLKRCNLIESLKLRHNSITSKGVMQLSSAFSGLSFLETLDLSVNELKDDGVMTLVDGLSNNTTMKVLNLSANGIGDNGAISLAAILFLMINLEVLDLSLNQFDSAGFIAVSKGVRRAVKLRRLRMGFFDAKCHQLDHTVQGHSVRCVLRIAGRLVKRPVQTFSFEGMREEGDIKGPRVLSSSLSVMANLQGLYLCFMKIGSVGIMHICQNLQKCTNLTVLDLRDNLIGRRGAVALSKLVAMLPKLVRINLCQNRLKNSGFAVVAKALQDNALLQSILVGDNAIGEHGCLAFAKFVPAMTKLRVVDISRNVVGTGGLAFLMRGLQKSDIEELYMDGCNIGDDGVGALAEALPTMKAVRKIYIGDEKVYSDNIKLTSSSAVHLAGVIPQCTSLERLSIRHTQFDRKSLSKLLAAVATIPGCKLCYDGSFLPSGFQQKYSNILELLWEGDDTAYIN